MVSNRKFENNFENSNIKFLDEKINFFLNLKLNFKNNNRIFRSWTIKENSKIISKIRTWNYVNGKINFFLNLKLNFKATNRIFSSGAINENSKIISKIPTWNF